MANYFKAATISGGISVLSYYVAAKTVRNRRTVYCNASEFSTKTVLITGAAGDMGHATAQAFAKKGARLVLVDLPYAQSKMEKDGKQLLKQGASKVLVLSADMTKAEDVQRMVNETVKTCGNIDCFFNNAGIQGEFQPLHKQSVEMFQRTLQVNAVGMFLGMKYVSLAMIEAKKGGVIVNTSSLAGLFGPPNMAAYTASKFAVSGLTRTGSKDLARYGIRVCAIAPGVLEGKMWGTQVRGQAQVLREIEGKTGDVSDEEFQTQEQKVIKSVPLQRLGKMSEVADIVVFLCSENASYVSGQIIAIDGGKIA